MTAQPKQVRPLQAIDDQLIDAEIDSVPQPRVIAPPSTAARLLLGISLVLIAFNLRPVFSSASAMPSGNYADIRSVDGSHWFAHHAAGRLPRGLFAARTLAGTKNRNGTDPAGRPCFVDARNCASKPEFRPTSLSRNGNLPAPASPWATSFLPGLVKRDFPDKAALMTGCYTMALCAGAAAAAGFTLPIEHLAEWLGTSSFGGLGAAGFPCSALMVAAGILAQPPPETIRVSGSGPVARSARLAGHAVHGVPVRACLLRVRLARADPARAGP